MALKAIIASSYTISSSLGSCIISKFPFKQEEAIVKGLAINVSKRDRNTASHCNTGLIVAVYGLTSLMSRLVALLL